jgi:hypothetical protein
MTVLKLKQKQKYKSNSIVLLTARANDKLYTRSFIVLCVACLNR